MTDTQLYLAIGVPVILNAGMIGVLMLHINAMKTDINERFRVQDQLFTEKLRRVEDVLDARLKQIEDRLGIGK
jgi:hypothetical protein